MVALDSSTIAFPDFVKSLTTRIEQEPDLTVAGRGMFERSDGLVELTWLRIELASKGFCHNQQRANAARWYALLCDVG